MGLNKKEFTSVPIMVLVFKDKKKAVIPIVLFSIIAGDLFINR